MNNKLNKIRENIVGINETFISPYGRKKIIYADYTATSRLYKPIERQILNDFAPLNGNTHTNSSRVGMFMTNCYEESLSIINNGINGSRKFTVLPLGGGATSAIYRIIEILNLKCGGASNKNTIVFLSHLEHNSNYLVWIKNGFKVVVVRCGENGKVCCRNFENALRKYPKHKKIVSVTAGSNVTGEKVNYKSICEIAHRYNALCFVDFAARAPYSKVEAEFGRDSLDAIFLSGHKFLGGPGSPGILAFKNSMYKRKVPSKPGGGTVDWIGKNELILYNKNIRKREDSGTPMYLQSIKLALAIKLKEDIGIEMIENREKEILEKIIREFKKIQNIKLIDENIDKKLLIVSFIPLNIHYNLFVKLLSDMYGIQCRGGCICAAILGQIIFNIDEIKSRKIYKEVVNGDNSSKPGFVRLSFSEITSDDEIEEIIFAVKDISENGKIYKKDYIYIKSENEFINKEEKIMNVSKLFELD